MEQYDESDDEDLNGVDADMMEEDDLAVSLAGCACCLQRW
jgi:hypothetical protein